MGFSFCHLGHAPRVRLWAAGVPRASKYFQTCSCGISNRRDDKMQVKFSYYGQTGDLGMRSKAQISLNFDFMPHFVYFLTNRR